MGTRHGKKGGQRLLPCASEELRAMVDDEDRVFFLVTGFGKFPGVPANPTEVLVNGLRSQGKADDGDGEPKRFLSCEVLKVSAKTVSDHLQELERLLDGKAGGSKFVVVHFGVDVCACRFKLEKRAINEADFRLPDEDGFQPRGAPVVSSTSDLEACLHTRVDVEGVSERLRQDGFDVQVSHDAGRYVCNYTYFSSLKRFENHEALYSLFVHVPSFHAIDAPTQAKFVDKLFERLAEDVKERRNPSAAAAAVA